MQTGLFHFLNDEAGAIAIEYALIAGGIALVIVSAVTAWGGAVSERSLTSAGACFEGTNCAILLTMGDALSCNAIKL
jgi:pilus assembly protein Flp/PilA